MAIPTVLRKTQDAFCLLLLCFVCSAGGSSLGVLFSRYIQVSKYASCGLSSSSTSSAIFVKILCPWTSVLLLDISNTNMFSVCYFQGICLHWLLQNTQATKTAGALHRLPKRQGHCTLADTDSCTFADIDSCSCKKLTVIFGQTLNSDHLGKNSRTCQKIRTPPHSLSPPLYPTPASPVKHAKKSEPLHTACLHPSTPLQPHQ